MAGDGVEEQHGVTLGSMQRARVQNPHSMNEFIADFVGVAMEQNVDTRVEESLHLALEMTVRDSEPQAGLRLSAGIQCARLHFDDRARVGDFDTEDLRVTGETPSIVAVPEDDKRRNPDEEIDDGFASDITEVHNLLRAASEEKLDRASSAVGATVGI